MGHPVSFVSTKGRCWCYIDNVNFGLYSCKKCFLKVKKKSLSFAKALVRRMHKRWPFVEKIRLIRSISWLSLWKQFNWKESKEQIHQETMGENDDTSGKIKGKYAEVYPYDCSDYDSVYLEKYIVSCHACFDFKYIFEYNFLILS